MNIQQKVHLSVTYSLPHLLWLSFISWTAQLRSRSVLQSPILEVLSNIAMWILLTMHKTFIPGKTWNQCKYMYMLIQSESWLDCPMLYTTHVLFIHVGRYSRLQPRLYHHMLTAYMLHTACADNKSALVIPSLCSHTQPSSWKKSQQHKMMAWSTVSIVRL